MIAEGSSTSLAAAQERLRGYAELNEAHHNHGQLIVGLAEHLTIREEQILELLAERLRDKEIADRLSISGQTVNFHLKNIYRKLGVSSRREAAAKAATR